MIWPTYMFRITQIIIIFLFFIYTATLLGYSSGQVNAKRAVSDTRVFKGDTIWVTVTVTNNEYEVIRGFYYSDFIPDDQDFIIKTKSVDISGQAVRNFMREQGVAGDVYEDYMNERWILETPPDFTEDNPLNPGDSVQIVYGITSGESKDCILPQFSWVGYLESSRAIYGHSEAADSLFLSFVEATLGITTTDLANAERDAYYSEELEATGGTPPYTWRVVDGTLPPGMTLDSISGVISGICSEEAVYEFEVEARDDGYPQETDRQNLSIEVSSTVSIIDDNNRIKTFNLYQNYPNPFNPMTVIPFSMRHHAFVEIRIYDRLGQTVRHLLNTELNAGLHKVSWDGRGDTGATLASGVYLVRMRSGHFTFQKKIIYLR